MKARDGTPTQLAQTVLQHSWEPPGSIAVKINMDAAFHVESETGAWGFVVRDETGSFLAGAAGRMEHVRSPLQAEVCAMCMHACMQAIQGAADLGAQCIIF